MTVKELIEKLQEFDPDDIVVQYNDIWNAVDDVVSVTKKTFNLNTSKNSVERGKYVFHNKGLITGIIFDVI